MEYVTKLLSKIGGGAVVVSDDEKKKQKKKKKKTKTKTKTGSKDVGVLEHEALGYIASNYGCDFCHQQIELEKPRYHCAECNNYDYCERCFQEHGTEHGHYMSKEVGDPAKLSRDISNGESMWGVLKYNLLLILFFLSFFFFFFFSIFIQSTFMSMNFVVGILVHY